MVILGGWVFFISEVPLYRARLLEGLARLRGVTRDAFDVETLLPCRANRRVAVSPRVLAWYRLASRRLHT